MPESRGPHSIFIDWTRQSLSGLIHVTCSLVLRILISAHSFTVRRIITSTLTYSCTIPSYCACYEELRAAGDSEIPGPYRHLKIRCGMHAACTILL